MKQKTICPTMSRHCQKMVFTNNYDNLHSNMTFKSYLGEIVVKIHLSEILSQKCTFFVKSLKLNTFVKKKEMSPKHLSEGDFHKLLTIFTQM